MLVELSRAQDTEAGDGTTTVSRLESTHSDFGFGPQFAPPSPGCSHGWLASELRQVFVDEVTSKRDQPIV